MRGTAVLLACLGAWGCRHYGTAPPQVIHSRSDSALTYAVVEQVVARDGYRVTDDDPQAASSE